jgi:hypothetical protein
MDWRCDSNGSTPALQLQSLTSKPSLTKKKEGTGEQGDTRAV